MNRHIKYLFKIKTSRNNLHLLNQDVSFTCHFYDIPEFYDPKFAYMLIVGNLSILWKGNDNSSLTIGWGFVLKVVQISKMKFSPR